jgi:hypothetical protein
VGQQIPDNLKQLYHKGYGRYYLDADFKQYAGRIKGKLWYPAVNKGTGPARKPKANTPTTPQIPQAPVAQAEPDKVADVAPSMKTRSVEVMGNLFSKEAYNITRGDKSLTVRTITNPETGKSLDINNPDERATALAILNNHINELMPKAREKAKRMAQKKISKSERQQLRKWLGNMGEICGLRDMLEAGAEAYLYADSHPKNDIAVVFEHTNGEDVREIMVVEVSTKSSVGSQGGRKESSSLPFVIESVEGKTIELAGEEFYAEDAAIALYAIHKLIYSSTTRGYVKRGTRYAEEREMFVPDEDLYKFDEPMLRKAQEEQQTAALRGEAGGQKKFVESRILSTEDISSAFDKASRPYGRIVAKVAKSMGISKDDNEGIMRASRLVDYYVDKLYAAAAQSTEEAPFRLSQTNDMVTDEVTFMLEKTNSNFSFESDLMTVGFDGATGYTGLQIVPKEVMTQRAIDTYGDISQMDKREQLEKLANWTFNTRGVGLSSRAGGYIDVLARVSPPLETLKDSDRLSLKDYLEYLKQLHIQRMNRTNGNQERDIQTPPAG